MTSVHLSEKAETYLRGLCLEIPSRRVGSKGNQAATDFFASIVASFGFETESPEFDCIDWKGEGTSLTVSDAVFEAFTSPYSLGCQVSAPLIVASTVEELEAAKVSDKIALLRGDIAREQLESSKLQILQQTATAMLAQANLSSSSVLALFR